MWAAGEAGRWAFLLLFRTLKEGDLEADIHRWDFVDHNHF